MSNTRSKLHQVKLEVNGVMRTPEITLIKYGIYTRENVSWKKTIWNYCRIKSHDLTEKGYQRMMYEKLLIFELIWLLRGMKNQLIS